jgi:DNA adenine methylase
MKYLGGKSRIASQITKFIIEYSKLHYPSFTTYFEPFCGSLAIISKINEKNYFHKINANDIQPDLIQLWVELQQDILELPKSITEQDYNNSRNIESPSSFKAVCGFFLSFGGKYFAGYADKYQGKSKRNFYDEMTSGLTKLKPLINGIEFSSSSYLDFKPNNCVIYCDPPYYNTSEYKGNKDKFNTELFWDKMREWSKDNLVFISELEAPSDFICVFEINANRSLQKSKRNKKTEKIFMTMPF